jgi:hypothetical protein
MLAMTPLLLRCDAASVRADAGSREEQAQSGQLILLAVVIASLFSCDGVGRGC